VAESPRSFRERDLYAPPPPDYKPPTLLAQHKWLAMAFVVACVAIASYLYLVPHGTRYAPPPKQPIYVDTVP
jgi:hypothetical protein